MEIRHRKNNRAFATQKKAATVALGAVVCCSIGYNWIPELGSPVIDSSSSFSNKGNKVYNNSNGVGIPVFYPIYSYAKDDGTATTAQTTSTSNSASPVTDKLVEDLRHSPSVSEVIGLDAEHPPTFLENCGINGNGIAVVAASGVEFGISTRASTSSTAKERFELLKASKQPHLAMELLKYCALEHYGGGVYLDSQSTLSTTLGHALSKAASSGSGNLAVLNDSKISPESIHGGILCITGEYEHESDSSRPKRSSSKKNSKKSASAVVEGMIRLLLSTELSVLESSPLFLPKSLYTLIAKDMGATELSSASMEPSQSESSWYLLQHTCSLFSLGQRQLTAPISPYALNSHR